ncbi:hypothetical protein V495_07472 [Pseudogymnoascus sp. VKM F-4514 (FW-929)]|nr:hypothetical protein V495_07472 [Pseudogymnoascus sp. VKM F-4514 (FW-929)]KFY57119.1 hypothetical protein V497_05752 [Pseudogymnoascus sp. VKM F-4516 (FW-969)]
MLFRRSTQERERRGRAARAAEDDQFAYEGGDESFLDFCTYCDSQLPATPHQNNLYCSERCRQLDHPLSTSNTFYPSSPPPSPYLAPTHYHTLHPSSPVAKPSQGRDIIPRLSPTLSSPSLYTPPTALASLRSISSGIARRAERDHPSPPESEEDSDGVVWAYKGKGSKGYFGVVSSPGQERPLPSRGGYGGRTRSVDLITPVGGF